MSIFRLFCRLCFRDRGRSRRRRGCSAPANAHQIIAQRLDLQIFFTPQDIVGAAGIKGRHLCAWLNFLRILEPFQDPARIETLTRERQIRRPAFHRSFGLLVALLVAAEAIEVIFRNQLLRRVDMLRRNFPIVDVREGNFDFRKTIKIADQLVGMFVGKSERRHANFQPGTDRYGRFQETKKPV